MSIVPFSFAFKERHSSADAPSSDRLFSLPPQKHLFLGAFYVRCIRFPLQTFPLRDGLFHFQVLKFWRESIRERPPLGRSWFCRLRALAPPPLGSAESSGAAL